MSTFWLKIAGIVVLVAVVVVLIGVFSSSSRSPAPATAPQTQSQPPAKNVYEQWERDQKRLNAEPQYKEPPPQPTQPNIPATSVQPPKPVEPPMPEFKKLNPEDEVAADQLWQWVVTQRKMGRLPVMTYGQMVKTCREIIQRWPESEYAFKAKRALADLPEKYRKMYNITDEEINLGNYK